MVGGWSDVPEAKDPLGEGVARCRLVDTESCREAVHT